MARIATSNILATNWTTNQQQPSANRPSHSEFPTFFKSAAKFVKIGIPSVNATIDHYHHFLFTFCLCIEITMQSRNISHKLFFVLGHHTQVKPIFILFSFQMVLRIWWPKAVASLLLIQLLQKCIAGSYDYNDDYTDYYTDDRDDRDGKDKLVCSIVALRISPQLSLATTTSAFRSLSNLESYLLVMTLISKQKMIVKIRLIFSQTATS